MVCTCSERRLSGVILVISRSAVTSVNVCKCYSVEFLYCSVWLYTLVVSDGSFLAEPMGRYSFRGVPAIRK